MNKKIIFLAVFLLFAVPVIWYVFQLNTKSVTEESFKVDSVFLKTAIKEKGSLNGNIKVTAFEDSHFDAEIISLSDFASIDSKSFDLIAGETRDINIIFSSPPGKEGDIYTGVLSIKAKEEKKIPIVLEVESEDVLFDGNLALFPTREIYQKDKINIEVKIFDLSRIGTASIEMLYSIKNFKGETMFSEKENLVVKDQVLITKSFSLPENIEPGDYVFGVVLKYKNSIGTSSSFFRIEELKADGVFNDKNFVYLIILFGVILIILLIVIFYFVYSKDKLIEELGKQYRKEVINQDLKVREAEKEREKGFESREEKRIVRKIFEEIKKKREKELEKIHIQRISKVKHLKKRKKKNELQKQVKEWRKKGYDTSVLESKVKIPSAQEIKKKIKEWKKKGYNTKVLEQELR